MYALIIALLSGCIAGGAARLGGLSLTWDIIIGAAVFLAVTVVISQIIRVKVKKINDVLQQIMQETQHKLMMMQSQFSRRPLGSPKTMLQALEKEQAAGIRRVIDACDAFTPLFRWNFLLDRQINTMKMAFYYQLKDFDKVDELMPKCLFIDPQSVCFKMARMYTIDSSILSANLEYLIASSFLFILSRRIEYILYAP